MRAVDEVDDGGWEGDARPRRAWPIVACGLVVMVLVASWAAGEPQTPDAPQVTPTPSDPVSEPRHAVRPTEPSAAPDVDAAGWEPVRQGTGHLFADATGAAVVVAHGDGAVTVIDLDTGDQRGTPVIVAPSPDGASHRLVPIGDDIVLTGLQPHGVDLSGGAPPRRYARHGDDVVAGPTRDVAWLVGGQPPQWAAERLADPAAGWRRIDDLPPDHTPVRALADGLLVRAADGRARLVAAPDGAVEDLFEGAVAEIVDVAGDLIAWCPDSPCERLVVSTTAGEEVASISGSGERYDPDGTSLAPDGRHLAVAVRVDFGVASDLRQRIHALPGGAPVAGSQRMLGTPRVAWAPDGDQVLWWDQPPVAGAPAVLARWAGGPDIEQIRMDGRGLVDVHDIVAVTREVPAGLWPRSGVRN